jgi:upstream activation factor subunit UAF30
VFSRLVVFIGKSIIISGGSAFSKPVQLSEELADIVGTDSCPRSEVVKKLWAYIKENKLQDPKNKQFAKCDEKLMKVIGVKKFKCFGMTKFLKDHMT